MSLDRYRLVDVLVAIVAAAGWRPVAGSDTASESLTRPLDEQRHLRVDRSDEHDLSGPADHG